ncbi:MULTISPECIES: hypothetical protein [unclassified Amycolatopsis]|uniref:hypothetical protein n=1 Tax=unclassified Amycolatopsis TaxID=2618356 RepID=UPI00068F27D4|nr:hypothetical protein [Amycolatopsis sp. Poz14]MCG3750083.1 hypothetical protein [Amycolatopsis sp. Poz14]
MGSNAATNDIVASARSSSGGFEMGGDRAIGNPPNWQAQESHQLYIGATTDNDPGTAEATGQHWAKHGTELKQASDDLYNAITELGNVWVGHGAASAQGALVAIANSGTQASDAAHTMSDRLARQAAAAAEVKKMPAPRDYDPKQAMTAALAGGPAALAADQKAQADAANDVKAQQVAFFNAYTQAMSEVDSSTPSFGPDSLGMKPTASHFNGNSFNNVNNLGHTDGPGALGSPASFGTVGAHGAAGGAAVAGHGAPAHISADSGKYGTSGLEGGALAGGTGVGVGAASGVGAAPVAAAPAPASTGGSGLGSALGLGAIGAGAGLAGGKLGEGNRSGSRKEEEGKTSAASEHQSGQSAASAAPQQQGVVPAGGTIGQSQGGMSPMGGMGGAGAHGAGEGDEEHTHASFLIEPDPDDAFGANQATPPPVIGAWSDDDN